MQNFLLTSKGPEGELKLTDFGLGVFFKNGERFKDLVGSPYYVAPEVHMHASWTLGEGMKGVFVRRSGAGACLHTITPMIFGRGFGARIQGGAFAWCMCASACLFAYAE